MIYVNQQLNNKVYKSHKDMYPKLYYIVVTVCEDGKYYSYVIKASLSDNLLSKLKIKNIIDATIIESKKRAEYIANFFNVQHKINGYYMFDEPKF